MSKSDHYNEDIIDGMLNLAYGKTSPTPEYRERLLNELKQVAGAEVIRRPLWKTTDWMIIAAIIIIFMIIYGLWLPQHIANTLLP
jgi:hypothetical protein